MNMGEKGLALLKEFEGLSLTAYKDPATGGEPYTIGYGHTSAAGPPKVTIGMRITKEEAEEILRRDLHVFEASVTDGTTNQFDAMVSLCYNIGPGNFNKSSVKRLHLAKDHVGAGKAFASWNKAKGPDGKLKIMAGLTRRRAAEAKLYGTV